MGVNTRTYRFVLGSALLEFGRAGADLVPLRDIASRYAARLLERGATSPQVPATTDLGEKDFLSVLEREREASIAAGVPTDVLVEAAVRLIPAMVMQKFHNLRVVGRVAHTFYTVECAGTNRFVRLTPELHTVAGEPSVLVDELRSRWSIVEASFDAGIGRGLIEGGVELDDGASDIGEPRRRVTVTSVRGSIAGFQHGRCFYCHQAFEELTDGVHVDHVFPSARMNTGSRRGPNLTTYSFSGWMRR